MTFGWPFCSFMQRVMHAAFWNGIADAVKMAESAAEDTTRPALPVDTCPCPCTRPELPEFRTFSKDFNYTAAIKGEIATTSTL